MPKKINVNAMAKKLYGEANSRAKKSVKPKAPKNIDKMPMVDYMKHRVK